MSSKLSISRAWDESRSRIAADGRLLLTVAFALIALPSAILAFAYPNEGMTSAPRSLGEGILFLLVTLVGLVGQLALIRLAIGPSISVGGAIQHGARRMPVYLVAAILLLVALFLLTIPFGIVMVAAGVSLEPGATTIPPFVWLLLILFLAIVLYAAARMLVLSAVASSEDGGPLTIIKRSWRLTRGNVGRLLGFLLLFIIAAGIVVGAVTVVTNLVLAIIFGPPEPLTVSALIVALVAAIANAALTTVFQVMLARIYLQLEGDAAVEPSVPSSGT